MNDCEFCNGTGTAERCIDGADVPVICGHCDAGDDLLFSDPDPSNRAWARVMFPKAFERFEKRQAEKAGKDQP